MSMRHFHCDVFSFDPTMDWKDGRKRGKRITFRKFALASKNADNQSLETDLFSHGLTYKSASPIWNWVSSLGFQAWVRTPLLTPNVKVLVQAPLLIKEQSATIRQ